MFQIRPSFSGNQKQQRELKKISRLIDDLSSPANAKTVTKFLVTPMFKTRSRIVAFAALTSDAGKSLLFIDFKFLFRVNFISKRHYSKLSVHTCLSSFLTSTLIWQKLQRSRPSHVCFRYQLNCYRQTRNYFNEHHHVSLYFSLSTM